MALSTRHIPDDGTLVLAVQRGDSEAFAELFRRHYPAVRRACSRRLSDAVEADEVAQAAFVRAFERIEQCAGDRRFGPWVHVIARSLCIDAFRAQARVEPWEQPPVGQAEHRPEGPEESLLRGERATQLQEALATLPDRQRRAVIARDCDELGPGEIAARLGLTVGAVDSLLLRARRRLAVAYRHRAGEAGGGATVLPVRSTAAAIGLALAVAPQAVMAGTAAAAQAVQGGARKAAGGVVAAVMSLTAGMAGDATPEPPPAPPPAVAVAETPAPLARTTPPARPVERPVPPPVPARPVAPVVETPDPVVPTVPATAEARSSVVDERETAAVPPMVVITTVPDALDTAPEDTGSSDAGSSDTGPEDTGSPATGSPDTSPPDSGPPTTRPAAPTVAAREVTVPARPTVEVEVPPVPVVETLPRPTVPGRG